VKHRWAFLAAIVWAGVGVSIACSTFEEDGPGPVEAGAEGASEAAAPETSTDAPIDTGLGRFCSRTDAAFCADFDLGGPTDGWDTSGADPSAYTFTPSDRSPPNALRATAGPVSDAGSDADGGAAVSATLVKRLVHASGTFGVAVLDMDIRLDEITPGSYAILGGLGYDFDAEYVSIFAADKVISIVVADTLRDAGATGFIDVPMGAWLHLTLELTLGGGVRALVNGESKFVSSSGLVDKTANVFVSAGAYMGSPGAIARVSFDNITFSERK